MVCNRVRMMTATQRWTVGGATITSVVEDETHHIPPEFFFPAATAAEVAAQEWLAVPGFADEHGNIALRIQAFVVETGRRRVLVDPCVGNNKERPIPFWNEMTWPFFERFTDAGFDAAVIDTVVHTHLHADHVGWDTHLVDGAWVPTFTNARHLYTARELAFCKAGATRGSTACTTIRSRRSSTRAWPTSSRRTRTSATASRSSRQRVTRRATCRCGSSPPVPRALITGDFLHHPVQCARPDWNEVGDEYPEVALDTRHRMLARAAESGALVLGTHFSGRPAGRVVAHGDVWRFVPE